MPPPPALDGWKAIDQLCNLKQPDDAPVTKDQKKIKTIIKVCNASGINFSVMCSANIDMAFKGLHDSKQILSGGTYKGGYYFKLNKATRKLVDEKAEEIFLATHFLSLSSNKYHYHNK